MDRLHDTYKTLEDLKQAMIGDVENPVLALIPLLAQMALSLAVIADKVMEGEDHETD